MKNEYGPRPFPFGFAIGYRRNSCRFDNGVDIGAAQADVLQRPVAQRVELAPGALGAPT